ncbi:MAG: Hsp70 family protein [Candidatus Pacebacteria bacterium]|nr:Hsp70 family protein [Candidatus Paceibacterota bacterium]
MSKILGIDLGTTNSAMAIIEGREPKIIENSEGARTTPSIMAVSKSGERLVGTLAKRQGVTNPENTLFGVKRLVGHDFEDEVVQKDSEIVPFKIEKSTSGGVDLKMGDKSYRPEEISAMLLQKLKTDAEAKLGEKITEAVITVPAYFNDSQRKATKDAGKIAGFDVKRIINEPTAAALAYGLGKAQKEERIAVYDLGGGTFDVSLIEVEDEIIEVLATDGDSLLGGDDFDRLLVDFFISCLPENAVSPQDLKVKARLKNTAESVKIGLSNESFLAVKEEFIASSRGKPVHLELNIERKDFEGLIEAELDKTFALLEKVLKTAGCTRSDITKVLLVGGSTYIPEIFNILNRRFGFDVHREVDPTFCVAIGAAIQGAIIAGEEADTILIDVNSHSLGIKCLNIKPFGAIDRDHYSIIIHKNTPIPASMTQTYYTVINNQKAVDIDVYQGENSAASKNTFLGSMVMDKLPKKLPEGSEIDVAFEYNLNGIVEISSFERQSGKKEKFKVDINRQEAVLEEAYCDGRGEEKGAVRQLEKGKQTEKEISRGKIERIINTARKKLDKTKDPETLNNIEIRIHILKEALKGDFASEKTQKKAKITSEELAELIAGI